MSPGAFVPIENAEHEARIVAPQEGLRQRDVGLVAEHRCRRELLAAAHDYALWGLFDDVERDLLILGRGPLLILRLQAAIDLRVAERMGEKEIVLHAEAVVIDSVLAEVAKRRRLDAAQFSVPLRQDRDEGSEDIRAASQLAPGLLAPDLAVAPLASQILGRFRDQPGKADAIARLGGFKGHAIPILGRVLQVVDAGKLLDKVPERGMRRDVGDLLAVQPDLAAVPQALDVSGAGHGAGRLFHTQNHRSPYCFCSQSCAHVCVPKP